MPFVMPGPARSLAYDRRRRGWRRAFPLIFLLAGLVLAPALATAQATDSVTVSWTAPGDDGTVGIATAYDLRVSESPINKNNFSQALAVGDLPAPRASGTSQKVTVRGLSHDRVYYFALKAVDDQGNWSEMSNLLRWDWTLDSSPPSTPGHVKVRVEADGVHVSWDPNGEPDLAGYNLYRSISGDAPIRLNRVLLTATEFVDTTVPDGSADVAYEVSAVDTRGNESALSPSIMIAVAKDEWELQPGYPNPSHLSESVRIPVNVPSGASGDARVEILDAGGTRVRRLTVPGVSPGTLVVVWDGTNDAGRVTAPGVYRAWLIAGDTRTSARLLRVP